MVQDKELEKLTEALRLAASHLVWVASSLRSLNAAHQGMWCVLIGWYLVVLPVAR
jgi:hypothetical protein